MGDVGIPTANDSQPPGRQPAELQLPGQRPGHHGAGYHTALPTANTTFYAVWEAKNVTISFEANGGTVPESMTARAGSPIGYNQAFPSTERPGYKLEGWYTNPELTGQRQVFLPTIYPTDNTVFYAKWNPEVAE